MRAQALRHAGNLVDVYSNSWGLPDYGFGEIPGPGPLTKQAIKEGVLKVSRFLSLTFECDFKLNRIRCVYSQAAQAWSAIYKTLFESLT